MSVVGGGVASLESVLLLAEFERFFAALGYRRDLLSDAHVVDRASSLDLATGLITRPHVVATDYQFRVAVHNEIGIVTREHQLTTALGFPYLLHDVRRVSLTLNDQLEPHVYKVEVVPEG